METSVQQPLLPRGPMCRAAGARPHENVPPLSGKQRRPHRGSTCCTSRRHWGTRDPCWKAGCFRRAVLCHAALCCAVLRSAMQERMGRTVA